ncbi:MAG: amidohydrolase [Firmicutes bacterium]|nr:amidohydrolase [Bacillota bacterium]
MNDFIKKQVTEKINKIFPQVVAFRRDLHEHPELSGQEERTSRRIAEELEKLGVSYRVTPEKAVVGTVPGSGPAPSGKYTGLGIRADFDALPIAEESGVAWASQNPGVMHACGHDMHAAMLLGTAMVLKSMPEAFGGNIKLLFQPNEEAEGGAENMIKAGCMEDPAVDAVIAFHIEPGIPSGYIQLCPGKMNAATCDVHITVEGVACHGAHPDRGIDAILAASQIVTALQAVVARNLAPTQPGVVTIGQFHAGNADNVVAGTAVLSGTLRALDMKTMAQIKALVKQTAEGVAAGFGAKATVELNDGYPSLENDIELGKTMEELAIELVGKDHIDYMEAPSLGADDFAFFTQYCDGVYMNVGTTPKDWTGKPQALHSEFLCPDEEAMKTGILMEATAALRLLGNL